MNIYKMKLHETIKGCNHELTYYITRVAGGWIYEMPRGNTRRFTSVFVPFNNEFQNN